MKKNFITTMAVLTWACCFSSKIVLAKPTGTMSAGDGIAQLLMAEKDNKLRAVRLDKTTAHKFVSTGKTVWRTDDSLWDMVGLKTGIHTHSQWINYMAKPGVFYGARVHCEYKPATDRINGSLELRVIGGADHRTGNSILFTDWQGDLWTAFLEPVKGQFGYPKWKVVSGDSH
jgi:hypothetical protein